MMTASTSWRSRTRRKSRVISAGAALKSFSIRARVFEVCSTSTSQSATHSAPSRSAARRSPLPWPPHPMSATRTRRFAPATRSCDAALIAAARDPSIAVPAAPAAASLINVRRVRVDMRASEKDGRRKTEDGNRKAETGLHPTSLVTCDAAAAAFGFAAAALLGDAAFLRPGGRLRFPPSLRARERLAQQRGEPFARILAVLRLRPEPPRVDDDDPFVRHAASGDRAQPFAHGVIQRRRARGVEAQLDGRRDLVDVLSPRPRRADEPLVQLALVERDRRSDRKHAESYR